MAYYGGPQHLNYTADSPLIIEIHGQATIPRKAERAVLHVAVSSTGTNKQRASDEVSAAAKAIRTILETHSPEPDASDEDKERAVIAHWNMTRLSSTSRQPYDEHGNEDDAAPPLFDVNLGFNIRVRVFAALGGLASKFVGMEHVSLNSIEWVLTGETSKAHESELRRMAATNALEQARDFGEPFGITSFRPVFIEPGDVQSMPVSYAPGGGGAGYHGARMRSMQTARKHSSGGGAGFGGSAQLVGPQVPGPERGAAVSLDGEAESDLAFHPEEINMSVSVHVKFIGEK